MNYSMSSSQTHNSSKTYSYHDLANVPLAHIDSSDFNCHDEVPPQSLQEHKLPKRLASMLSDADLAEIITWMPHGRSWKVLDRDRFIETALPRYFGHSKYQSFVRIVNAWGFRRVTEGPDRDSYYHEMFLRGKPQLHERMKRIPARHRKAPVNEANKCPNFYKIAQTSPLPEVPMTRSGDRRVVNQTSENSSPVERAVSSNVASVSLHQNILFEALAKSLARRDMVVPTSVASVNASQMFAPRYDMYDAQLVDRILYQRMNFATLESMRARKLQLHNILNRSNNGARSGNVLQHRDIAIFDSNQLQSQLGHRTSEPYPFNTPASALDYRDLNIGVSSNFFCANAFFDLDERFRDHLNTLIAARSERSRWVGGLSQRRMKDDFRK